MRLHRFKVSQPLGEDVVIDNVSLVKQWAKVFRYTEGDFIILFNGEGLDVTYRIDTVSKTSFHLIRTKQTPSFIPTKKVTLYLSLIKKDNFELVVQKATELGVTTIVPVLSERSEKKNLSFERLETIATEALEQCGRGDAVTIHAIVPLTDALDNLKVENSPENQAIFLQMSHTLLINILSDKEPACDLSLFVGPEGGWSPREEELFVSYGITPASLGETVLRAETAAITACAFACV